MLLENIILHCITKLHRERSAASILHLLNGKRSTQTLQDAHMFSLSHFFGIHPKLRRHTFEETITNMKAKRQLPDEDDGTQPAPLSSQLTVPYFDGMRFHQHADQFMMRLFLFIQVLANHAKQTNHFVPIYTDPSVQQWVKHLFYKQKDDLEKWLPHLHQELLVILQGVPEIQAAIVTDRLTGYQHIGLSKVQLAVKYNISEEDVGLYLTSASHVILNQVEQHPDTFPYLALFLTKKKTQRKLLTATAAVTRDYLQKGYSIEAIASIRSLTVSTIQDHIIEMAWLDGGNIAALFISKAETEVIRKSADRLKTKKLKLIYQDLEEFYSYFQIRLALAQTGGLPKERIH